MSEDPWLSPLRAASFVIVTALLLAWLFGSFLFVRGIFTDLETVLVYTFFESPTWTPEAVSIAAAELGISPALPSWIWLFAMELPMIAAFGGLGLLLLLRVHSRVGAALSVSFVFIGTSITGPVIGIIETVLPGADSLGAILAGGGFFALVALFFYFPNGRFVPRWSRWLVLFAIPAFFYATIQPASTILGREAIVVSMGTLLVGAGSQIYRYLRVSTPLEKMQTRWVMAALVTMVGVMMLVLLLMPDAVTMVPDPTGPMLVQWLASYLAATAACVLFAVALTVAVLRYRLYSIDLIIRRTAVYGLLTALLALVYYGTVLSIQQVLTLFNAGQSPLSIVVSTLLIAALFNPLRVRVQRFIDRRFFRARYDARRTLERFAAAARDEVNLAELTTALEAVVGRTMQPAQLNVWIRDTPNE